MTRLDPPAAATLDILRRALPASVARVDILVPSLERMTPRGEAGAHPPDKLLDMYEALPLRAAEGESIARQAGLVGGAELLRNLGAVASKRPEVVLRFLEAVVTAWRGTPTAPPPATLEAPSARPAASHPNPGMSAGTGAGREVRRAQDAGPVRRGLSALRNRLTQGQAVKIEGEVPPYASTALEDGITSVVSTGLCETPGGPVLANDRTLGAGRRYHLFVEVGRELSPGSLDREPTPLPPLARGTVLQFVLFGFEGGLRPVDGSQIGLMTLTNRGEAVVSKQPSGPSGGKRLHLPFETPPVPGTHRLRCNVYHEQTLLQSRLLEVVVTDQPGRARIGALRVTLDFAALGDLEPDLLSKREPRTLSLLINDNGNGSHGFRFFGTGDYVREVSLGAQTLEVLLAQARGELCRASWGDETAPTRDEFSQLTYRYATPSPVLLQEDLVALARRGYKIWDALIDTLAGGDWEGLRDRMRLPGRVEIANKESLSLLVPAASLYDAPLAYEEPDLTVCRAFLEALGSHPVSGLPCFAGHCPSYDDERVVCPSGFWGFRHQIGHQASFTGGAPQDARNQSVVAGQSDAEPTFIVGISTDPGLVLRDGHISRLHAVAGAGWRMATSRTELYSLFKSVQPTVVYLYGHGGGDKFSPFFEVGNKNDGPIDKPSLRTRANWQRTHPLVFLNGCHSAALSPDSAFDYAVGFLQVAHASAVVGTEIAVFESLAVTFAEECLQRFVVERRPLGEAVLQSRLALLDRGVPLGLAYLAFGPAEVRVGPV